ncbi:MAG: metallophosphoesterase [Fusicatenibacter sp.]|nr:metallophosphoesterase [Lachnospiraceae bacterium]MDY2938857.1 metallophosphoesterase [Fusicatenibacter sp.]
MLALVIAPIYVLLNVFTAYWLLRWMAAVHQVFTYPVVLAIILALYVFFSLSLLTGFLVKKEPFHRILKIISNYWLGVYLYSLIFTLLMVVIHKILSYSLLYGTWLYSKKGLQAVGLGVIAFIAGVTIYGVIQGKKIRLVKYRVKLGKPLHLRIALAADLHLGYSVGKHQVKRMVRMINREHPDLVVIAGDIFDNEYDAIREPEETAQIFAGLNSRLGTYSCWGNHDLDEKILAGFTFAAKKDKIPDVRFERFLKKAGIHMLADESVFLDQNFYLAGRKDPDRSKKTGESRCTPEKLFRGMDREYPILVLDHQPKELDELSLRGADLVLGGHTHDGQMFPGNLLTRLIWENSAGMLKKGDMYSIVTSGVGMWGPCMRIGTHSEVVIIDVGNEE